MKRIQWNELIVPAMVFVFAFSFWIQVRGQSRAVVIVPYIIIALILILIGFVIFSHAVSKAEKKDLSEGPARLFVMFQHWFFSQKRELALIALSIAYCFLFDPFGFTGSNFIFLMLAFPIAGLKLKKSVVYGCATTVVMYAVSEILQLTAPQFPWFLR